MIRSFGSDLKELEQQFRLIEDGRVNKKLKYSSKGYRVDVVRNRDRYFFFSNEIKDRITEEVGEKLSKLKEINSKMGEHGEGLVLVAMIGGPKLSLSEPGSLGRVGSIKISQITGPDEFHGYIGQTRVLRERHPDNHAADQQRIG